MVFTGRENAVSLLNKFRMSTWCGPNWCIKCNKIDASANLSVCPRCKLATYCSRECQEADWKAHRPLCSPDKLTVLDAQGDVDYSAWQFKVGESMTVSGNVTHVDCQDGMTLVEVTPRNKTARFDFLFRQKITIDDSNVYSGTVMRIEGRCILLQAEES